MLVKVKYTDFYPFAGRMIDFTELYDDAHKAMQRAVDLFEVDKAINIRVEIEEKEEQ